MGNYFTPSVSKFDLDNFAVTQSISGEIVPLNCIGQVEPCDARPLGASCDCGNSVQNITFLATGVQCSDIHNGADCTMTPACLNPHIDATQCDEGCVVHIRCDAPDGCEGVDLTASCPGFEDCSANAGATVC